MTPEQREQEVQKKAERKKLKTKKVLDALKKYENKTSTPN